VPQSGWIQVDSFTTWFTESSISTVKHSLAVPEWSSSWKGRNSDVKIWPTLMGFQWCLLPHCTHRKHAFRCSFVLYFKASYAQKIDNRLKTHPQRVVPGYQVASLMRKAWQRPQQG
jgi:hypothetical protein